MKESKVQTYLKTRVESAGGVFRRLQWIGRSHAQDAFIGLNGSWLVECKRPGQVERPGQARERQRLVAVGVRCRVVSSLDEVDAFMQEALDASTPS